MKQQTRTNIFWKVKARDKVSPARLFADTDRDGVANVFDCRPRNPRRQDDNNGSSDDKPKSKEEIKKILDEQGKAMREGMAKIGFETKSVPLKGYRKDLDETY